MYSGTQKKVIVIKNTDNSIFESAYFILKDNIKNLPESEMVREANRILNNNIIGNYYFEKPEKKQKKSFIKKALPFFSGVLFSFLLTFLFFVFIK